MKKIQRFGSGSRLSEAVAAGGLVFLSGMVAEAGGGIAEQTADVLHQIDCWLAECGSDKSHILEAVIWLADMADYNGMNAVWDAWIDAANPPARACTQARLANPDWKVEIKVTAIRKD